MNRYRVQHHEGWWKVVTRETGENVGTFINEGTARFACHAMNCHNDLVTGCKAALPTFKGDCDYPSRCGTEEIICSTCATRGTLTEAIEKAMGSTTT